MLTSQPDYVEAHVMQLSPFERNQLLQRPIVSFDTDLQVEAAWEQVADQREADIAARRAHWIHGDKALRQLRARPMP